MLRILAYGFPLDANFGGPSVVHGLHDALERVYPGCGLVVYQQRKVEPVSASDQSCPVRHFPYWKRVFRFYRDGILLKWFGRRPRSAAAAQFWDDFRAADAVVDIYAICFCSTIRTHMSTTSRRQAVRVFLQAFGIGLMARLWGKLSVKSASSFGPLEKKTDVLLARLACRWALTRIVAREEESRRQLVEVARVRRAVEVAPDLANTWAPPVPRAPRPRIGFAVSFQSENQWRRRNLDYMKFMRELVAHACAYGDCEVVLLPNQTDHGGGRSDVVIAEEIRAALGDASRVFVFDTVGSSPTALREMIATCSLVVSCRYHACVAAFASAVPTLVLGWHCKYRELVRHYGQERWMLSTEACAKTDVRAVLDALWHARSEVEAELRRRRLDVVAAVDRSVSRLFEGVGDGRRVDGSTSRGGGAVRTLFAGAFLVFLAVFAMGAVSRLRPGLRNLPVDSFEAARAYVAHELAERFPRKNDFVDLNGASCHVAGFRLCNHRLRYRDGTLGRSYEAFTGEHARNVPSRIRMESVCCRKRGIPYLLVVPPCRIDLDGRLFPRGWEVPNPNQAGMGVVRELETEGIPVLNLIPVFAATPESVRRGFFETDHHWRYETALRATGMVVDRLAELLGDGSLKAHPNLDGRNWEWREDGEGFLGSHGRRVGRYFGGSSRFRYCVPRFETSLRRRNVSRKKTFRGDFVEAEMETRRLATGNPYGANKYALYTGPDVGLQVHENPRAPSSRSVFLVKDSFGDPVAAFLATVFRRVVQVDPRRLPPDESVERLIARHSPDVVVDVCAASSLFADAERRK